MTLGWLTTSLVFVNGPKRGYHHATRRRTNISEPVVLLSPCLPSYLQSPYLGMKVAQNSKTRPTNLRALAMCSIYQRILGVPYLRRPHVEFCMNCVFLHRPIIVCRPMAARPRDALFFEGGVPARPRMTMSSCPLSERNILPKNWLRITRYRM